MISSRKIYSLMKPRRLQACQFEIQNRRRVKKAEFSALSDACLLRSSERDAVIRRLQDLEFALDELARALVAVESVMAKLEVSPLQAAPASALKQLDMSEIQSA